MGAFALSRNRLLSSRRRVQEAVPWLAQCAEQEGNPIAAFNLGEIYYSGLGVEQNFLISAKCYLAAACSPPNARQVSGTAWASSYLACAHPKAGCALHTVCCLQAAPPTGRAPPSS